MPDRPTPRHILCALAPASLVVYLGLEGGGFDPIVFGRVGVGAWLLLGIAALAGALSLAELPRRGLLVLGLLAAFAAWTGLSMIWSESADRSATELARALSYLGILVLFCALQRSDTRHLTLGSLATGIGVIVVVALLARMQPLWFPKNETLDLVFASEARLNYPLNYWNGLAGLIAIGAPLLAWASAHARRPGLRMLAAAGLPAFGLALYLTISRGGALALGIALVALLVLDSERLRLLLPLALGATGSLLLIRAAEARDGFIDGLRAGDALGQGDEMTLLTVLVCTGAAAGVGIAHHLGRDRRAELNPLVGTSPRRRRHALLATAVVVLAVAVVADAPGRVSDGWEEFKDPGVERDSGRLSSASGNGRYQWWDAARRANASAPVLGIGAGTFELWWAREGTIASQVVDAHSLYLEALGELGVVGLLLIVSFVGAALLVAVRFTRAASGEQGALGAAATATAFAFAAAAATDWAWELPVLPVSFLIALAAILGGSATPGSQDRRRPLAAVSLTAVLLLLPPLLGLEALRSSQERAAAGELPQALDDARRASTFEPYSGPAALQEALVLELIGGGELADAAAKAREATREEPTNWENWVTLSRIEYQRGRVGPSIEAYRRARELNPSSLLFQEDPVGVEGEGAGALDPG